MTRGGVGPCAGVVRHVCTGARRLWILAVCTGALRLWILRIIYICTFMRIRLCSIQHESGHHEIGYRLNNLNQ